MPFALVAALIASLGVHAAALFIPDAEPSPAAEPVPLTAEIVLRPRPAPSAPETLRKPVRKAPAPRPAPAAVAPVPPAATSAADVAADASPAPSAAGETTGEAVAEATAEAAVAPAAGDGEAPPDAASPQLPATGEIRYVVQRGDPPVLIGSAVHRWRMADGRYRIASTMETTGVAAWLRAVRLDTESSGRLVADGLAPERYRSRRTDRGRERVEQVDFDRDAGLVRFASGATAPLPAAGAQDLLSFNYQLGWLARTGDMTIATGRKLGTWRLELLGREWLETPQRQIWTLHFRASGETTTEVWLAPDEHLLPVKILHIDKKGERFEQVVEAIDLDPPPDGAPE